MSALLDPWSDAATIARRLAVPDARLVVLIGAEAWCEKCRVMRPAFEARASTDATGDVWIWLDLEDHSELVGDFLPDDLPWLIVHHGAAMTFNGAIDVGGPALEVGLSKDAPCEEERDPGVRARLLQADWAS